MYLNLQTLTVALAFKNEIAFFVY